MRLNTHVTREVKMTDWKRNFDQLRGPAIPFVKDVKCFRIISKNKTKKIVFWTHLVQTVLSEIYFCHCYTLTGTTAAPTFSMAPKVMPSCLRGKMYVMLHPSKHWDFTLAQHQDHLPSMEVSARCYHFCLQRVPQPHQLYVFYTFAAATGTAKSWFQKISSQWPPC